MRFGKELLEKADMLNEESRDIQQLIQDNGDYEDSRK